MRETQTRSFSVVGVRKWEPLVRKPAPAGVVGG
jgi:hypothetical protein